MESADFAFRGHRGVVSGASIVSIRNARTNQYTNQGNLNDSQRIDLHRCQLIFTHQNNHIKNSRQRADEAKTGDTSSRSPFRRVLRRTRQRRTVVCGDRRRRRRRRILRCCRSFIGEVHFLSRAVDVAQYDLATKTSEYSIKFTRYAHRARENVLLPLTVHCLLIIIMEGAYSVTLDLLSSIRACLGKQGGSFSLSLSRSLAL